jgi:hypothetical protein
LVFPTSLLLGFSSAVQSPFAMNASEQAPLPSAALDESTELLRRRLRTVLLLCVPPIALFAVLDLYLVEQGRLAFFYALKLAALAVVLAAYCLWLGRSAGLRVERHPM